MKPLVESLIVLAACALLAAPSSAGAQAAGAIPPAITAPGKGWFLRLYSPLQPFFDRSWRPSEIELVP